MSVIDSIPVEQLAVRVKNCGDKTLRGQAMTYAGAEYVIEPGGERVMPWLAACHFFGDPRAVNIGDPDQDRATQFRRGECERLSVHYGVYDVPWYSDVPDTTPGGDNELHMDEKGRSTGLVPYVSITEGFMHPSLPRVEVTRMDNNEKVYTVLEDPAGAHAVAPRDAQGKLEVDALQSQYTALKQQLDELQRDLEFRSPGVLTDADADPLDNIPTTEAVDAPDTITPPDQIVDSMVDPEVPDVPATEDSPRRPTPKRKS